MCVSIQAYANIHASYTQIQKCNHKAQSPNFPSNEEK